MTGDIVLEIKLPVPVKELAAVTDALCKIHGKNSLFMRQVGPMLQLYKLRVESPPNKPFPCCPEETVTLQKV